MSPRSLRDLLGFTRAQWARLVGSGESTVYRWESGASSPTGASAEVMVGIRRALERDEHSARAALSLALETGGLASLVESALRGHS